MKVFIFAFAVLFAGISAAGIPNHEVQQVEPRLITDAIASVIEDLINEIRELGLDPLVIERAEASYALPVPSLLTASAEAVEILSNGLSNIVIHNLNYSVLTFRLTFDVSLPMITFSIGDASAHVSTFGYDLRGQIKGNLAIRSIRVAGEVRVSVGIISGISISSIRLTFTLGGVDSDLNVQLFGYDLTNFVNNFASNIIPDAMLAYRADINQLLEIVVLDYINSVL